MLFVAPALMLLKELTTVTNSDWSCYCHCVRLVFGDPVQWNFPRSRERRIVKPNGSKVFIQPASQRAATEIPLGQINVKAFANTPLDVWHPSNGEIMAKMCLLKVKRGGAAFVEWHWSFADGRSRRTVWWAKGKRRRTVQVAASRRLLWCYVGNWKKRVFLLWESVCEPGLLETHEFYRIVFCCFNFTFIVFICSRSVV